MQSVLTATLAVLLQRQLLLLVFVAGSGVVLLAALFAFEMNFDSCGFRRHFSLHRPPMSIGEVEPERGFEPPTLALQKPCSTVELPRLVQGVGFEPTKPQRTSVLQTDAFGHSATPAGAGTGDRTRDLILTKDALFRLSYPSPSLHCVQRELILPQKTSLDK